MKKLMMGLLGICLYISGFAQTVSIVFRGNQVKNYRIVIDGTRYYSNNAVGPAYQAASQSANAAARTLTITDLQPGTHRIQVYSTASAGSTTGGQLVYTNNFQLREEYDMAITVNGNRITFSEKINPGSNANGQYRTAMSSANFQKELTRIRQNRYQDARVAAIRTTLGSADYFTTDQISQLLTLVNAEATRLELAKSAYAVVSDPANFGELRDLFDSQSYRTNLDEYIRIKNITNAPTSTVANRALLSTLDYELLIQNLNKNNYQSGKYNIVNEAFNNRNYAFTTTQIRQLLGAITSEPDRLYLAKAAYSTVSDRDNFNTLLTMFSTQAHREELNTYIVNSGGIGSNTLVITRTPMQEAVFADLLKRSGNHIRVSSRYTDVRAAFSNPLNYFSSYQAKQLIALVGAGSTSGGLLSISENNKIELAKLAYTRITDPGNFSQVIDLFENQSSRDEINSYIRTQVSY